MSAAAASKAKALEAFHKSLAGLRSHSNAKEVREALTPATDPDNIWEAGGTG